MFPVFSNLSDLSQKESIKERQNIEVKRTKNKEFGSTDECNQKKKKPDPARRRLSSVVEHWSCKPRVESSILSVAFFPLEGVLIFDSAHFSCYDFKGAIVIFISRWQIT